MPSGITCFELCVCAAGSPIAPSNDQFMLAANVDMGSLVLKHHHASDQITHGSHSPHCLCVSASLSPTLMR